MQYVLFLIYPLQVIQRIVEVENLARVWIRGDFDFVIIIFIYYNSYLVILELNKIQSQN